MSKADPNRLGDFELLDELGRDGSFVLYRAQQMRLSRLVTLKVLPIEDAEAATRLAAEAAAALDHPGALPVLESGTIDGVAYLALAAVEGETLAERLRRGPIAPREAADWTRQMAETLFAAHKRGTRHGQLRPECVHLGRDGVLRLSGFGPAGTESRYRADRSEAIALGKLLYHMVAGTPCPSDRREMTEVHDGELAAVCWHAAGGHYLLVEFIADLRRFLHRRPVRARRGLWWRIPASWVRHNRRALLAITLAAVGLAAPAWQQRRAADGAWAALCNPDPAAEEVARATQHFARWHEDHPGDPEASTALALAHYRAGELEEAQRLLPLYTSSSWVYVGGEARWRPMQTRIWALVAVHTGRYRFAKSALAGLADHHVPASAGEKRLLEEYRRDTQSSDLLAQSIDYGDEAAVVAARELPATQELVRSLLRQRAGPLPEIYRPLGPPDNPQTWPHQNSSVRVPRHVVDQTLQAVAPNWPRHPGARRAIPELIACLARPKLAAEAEAMLTAIDPHWPRLPEARRGIGPLLLQLPAGGWLRPEDGDKTALRLTLERIDPNWRRLPEAREAAVLLAQALGWSEAQRNSHDQGKHAALALAGLGPAAASVAPELWALLDREDPAFHVLPLVALDGAEPGWKETERGRRALDGLVEGLGRKDSAELCRWVYLRLRPLPHAVARRALTRSLAGDGASSPPDLLEQLMRAKPQARVSAALLLGARRVAATPAVPALVVCLFDEEMADNGAHGHAALRALNDIAFPWYESAAAQEALPRLIRWATAIDVRPTGWEPCGQERERLREVIPLIDPLWDRTNAAREEFRKLRIAWEQARRPTKAGDWQAANRKNMVCGQAAQRLGWFARGRVFGDDAVRALCAGLDTDDESVRRAVWSSSLRNSPSVRVAVPFLIDALAATCDHPSRFSSDFYQARDILEGIDPLWHWGERAERILARPPLPKNESVQNYIAYRRKHYPRPSSVRQP